MEAIESLHAAGDPAYLFTFWRQNPPPDIRAARPKMKTAAQRSRLRAARNAVLYAAFSAEAYVNEFLAAHGVLDDWDYEPTHRKFLKGTEAAYGSQLFFADREAYPEIVQLIKLRDRLAHPKPGFGVQGVGFEADEAYARLFSLPRIAEYIVMVGGAGDLLVPRAYGMDQLDVIATVAWRGRDVIRDYAARHRRLPAWNAPSERQLFRQAGDMVMARPPLQLGRDSPHSRLAAAKAASRGDKHPGSQGNPESRGRPPEQRDA
jgi:hypothetical protein